MTDQTRMIRAEAREIRRHIAAGGGTDYPAKRALIVDKLYGPGSRDAIRELIKTVGDDDETCGEG